MAPEVVPAAVLPIGRSGEYAGSARESWRITDSVEPSVAMSGKNWWPVAAGAGRTIGPVQVSPSLELRAKTCDCPAAVRAFQTTCTPLASAATADRLEKRA